MDHHDHVHVIVDVGHPRAQPAHLEELPHLGKHGPRLVVRRRIEFHAQGIQQRNHFFLRTGQVENEAGQVVFKKGFSFRIEKRDDLLVIGAVHRRQAEIDHVSLAVQGNALQAQGNGRVLGDGICLGIENLEPQLAGGQIDVVFQQLAHPDGVIRVDRALAGQGAREKEPNRDRLVDVAQHSVGALRQREQPVLRKIEPLPLKHGRRKNVYRNQEDGGEDDTDHRELAPLDG